MAPDASVHEAQQRLDEAFASFEREHPEVAEALRAMRVSFEEYLRALASQRDTPSVSGNARSEA